MTDRVRLGTSVLDALFHAPVVLAKRYATLDQLSNGRASAGLGQGGWQESIINPKLVQPGGVPIIFGSMTPAAAAA